VASVITALAGTHRLRIDRVGARERMRTHTVETARTHAHEQPTLHVSAPRIEVAGVTPSLEKHIVQQVFRLATYTDDAHTEREHHPGVTIVQAPERLFVAARDAPQHLDVVVDHASHRPERGRSSAREQRPFWDERRRKPSAGAPLTAAGAETASERSERRLKIRSRPSIRRARAQATGYDD
jgi:hypothetical protein